MNALLRKGNIHTTGARKECTASELCTKTEIVDQNLTDSQSKY